MLTLVHFITAGSLILSPTLISGDQSSRAARQHGEPQVNNHPSAEEPLYDDMEDVNVPYLFHRSQILNQDDVKHSDDDTIASFDAGKGGRLCINRPLGQDHRLFLRKNGTGAYIFSFNVTGCNDPRWKQTDTLSSRLRTESVCTEIHTRIFNECNSSSILVTLATGDLLVSRNPQNQYFDFSFTFPVRTDSHSIHAAPDTPLAITIDVAVSPEPRSLQILPDEEGKNKVRRKGKQEPKAHIELKDTVRMISEIGNSVSLLPSLIERTVSTGLKQELNSITSKMDDMVKTQSGNSDALIAIAKSVTHIKLTAMKSSQVSEQIRSEINILRDKINRLEALISSVRGEQRLSASEHDSQVWWHKEAVVTVAIFFLSMIVSRYVILLRTPERGNEA